MAIDSFAKRASSAGIGIIGRSIIPPDNANLDSSDQRRASNSLYSGIDDSFVDAGEVSGSRIQIQRKNLLLR